MARIRTIKPSFFRHGGLFDLEQETGLPIRIGFAGLWTCADREGRFKWEPRELKLDCLPHDQVDFSRVLDALASRGFVVRYRVVGRDYGFIPGFPTHQVINNKEMASELPEPPEGIEQTQELTREARVDDAKATPLILSQGEYGRERNMEGNMEGKGRDIGGAVAPDPVRIAFDEYNLLAEQIGLPKAQILDDRRRKGIAARLKEGGDLDGWRHVLSAVKARPWMHGGNDRDWRADLDFLIQRKSFTKLMEGSYGGTNPKRDEWADLLRPGGDSDLVGAPRLVGSA